MRCFFKSLTVITALMASTAIVEARDIVFARVSEHASIDPLFNAAGNDASTAPNMFESLVNYDAQFRVQPLLATSWRNIDPTTWEFKLRRDVKFHDGSPFTADDVVFSFDRAAKVVGSPASWGRAVALVASVEAIDPHTVLIKTKQPMPLLIDNIGGLYICSRVAAAEATTEDFNTGKAAVGTGPYKFVSWSRGNRLEMTANNEYWGSKPEFERVTYRFIPNNSARIAALLSGEVDIIDAVPPTELETIKSRPGYTIWSGLTTRLTHLQMDTVRDKSPFVTDPSGTPMEKNPLKDPKVREALSLMINRDLLVERIAGGQGVPAGQIVPEGLGGYDPSLKPDPYDLARAKQLLIDAGYPKGFGLTIHSTNDRFPEDSAVLQVLGQMFSRGGIKINGVQSMPFSVLLKQASEQRFSLFQYAYNGSGPNASEFLKNILATPNPKLGNGASNRTLFSNPEFDMILQQALEEFDEERRNRLLAKATKLVLHEVRGNLIPLYWQKHAWATKDDLAYEPNLQDLSIVRYLHKK